MELLINENFNINEYCGGLVITYFEKDKASVCELFDKLDSGGYSYTKNELSYHSVIKNSYISEIENILDGCGCYVLVLSKGFNDPDNNSLRTRVWYQIGSLQAKQDDCVIPVCLDGSDVSLAATPLQQHNIITSADDLINTFIKKFRSSIVKSEYYANSDQNKFASKRIDYRKLIVKLDITKDCFEEAKEIFADDCGEGDVEDKDFEKVLRDDLTCACKLISFGSDNIVTTQLSPYKSEMEIIPCDYPTNFSCKKLYVTKKDSDDVIAEYLFELIVPVHRLFGVNFKPYFEIRGNLSTDAVEALFASNFSEKSDVHKVGSRLYFSLAFPKAKAYSMPDGLGIGLLADYLFPQ